MNISDWNSANNYMISNRLINPTSFEMNLNYFIETVLDIWNIIKFS